MRPSTGSPARPGARLADSRFRIPHRSFVRYPLLPVLLLFTGAPAFSQQDPVWDLNAVTAWCPACEQQLSWGSTFCDACSAKIRWGPPGPPRDAAQAWRFLSRALREEDRVWMKDLVEGDPLENARALALLPDCRPVRERPAESGGTRVALASTDRATTLVLVWKGGKFLAAGREAHRPLRNEDAAVRALRAALEAERAIRDRDLDGDGRANFWTADWSGLARLADADGKPIALLPEGAAAADLRPSAAGAAPRPYLTAAPAAAPWNGYRFVAVRNDETGAPLAADRFAFAAAPVEWGVSGWKTILVSEDGAIWARDAGPSLEADRAAGGGSGPTAEESAAIAAAIRDLDVEDLAKREAATATLSSLGRKAEAAMRAALPAAGAEGRMRLGDLLRDLEGQVLDLDRWPMPRERMEDRGWTRM